MPFRPLLFLLLSLVMFQVQAQKKSKELPLSDFPRAWVGTWKGQLDIYGPKGKQTSLPMELHIKETTDSTRFGWTIVYAAEKRDERPYELVVVDRPTGHFQVDEKDSIVLDSYLMGNVLTSIFSVEGMLLLVKETFEAKSITMEIYFTSLKKAEKTGLETTEVEEVLNYPVQGRHFAKLTRED